MTASLARFTRQALASSPIHAPQHSDRNPTTNRHNSLTHTMAGFKRGGSRGSSGASFKKGYAKKRSSPEDDDSAPRTSKKTKSTDEEDDGKAVIPKLNTDDDGNKYIGVSNYQAYAFKFMMDN